MTTRELERRFVAQPLELRAADSGPGHLVGYAAKFGTYSQNLGGFVETIEPGAFDKSLADNVRALCRYNHDDAALLGTTEAGTLALQTDSVGLFYDVTLPETQWGHDCGVLAARGDLRYSSFAFYCIEDEWDFTEQGFPLRRVLAAQLVDVAPVNSPAYLDTSVAKRSLAERIHVPMPELEKKSTPEVRRALVESFLTEQKRALADLPDDVRTSLQKVLDLVAAADDAVDQAMPVLADVLGVANPDTEQDAEMQKNSDHGQPEQRAEKVSDKPWSDFSAADYTLEQYRRACLIVENGGKTKDDCKLPVREPDGTLNRNGCHAAAQRLGQVDAPADEKATAARKLVALYKNSLKETPPDSLVSLAGRSYMPPDTEQRDTHSAPVSLERLRLELDALK